MLISGMRKRPGPCAPSTLRALFLRPPLAPRPLHLNITISVNLLDTPSPGPHLDIIAVRGLVGIGIVGVLGKDVVSVVVAHLYVAVRILAATLAFAAAATAGVARSTRLRLWDITSCRGERRGSKVRTGAISWCVGHDMVCLPQ